MKFLEYHGYTGTIEYSPDDNLLYGQVMGIKSLISYEGRTGKQLESNFKEVVDDYLVDCEANGMPAEKAFKGSFNVRISSEMHRQAVLFAQENKMSLNGFVVESIRAHLHNAKEQQASA